MYILSVYLVLFSHREVKRQKIDQRFIKPYVTNKEDTYLTLEVLTHILDELSEPSKLSKIGTV